MIENRTTTHSPNSRLVVNKKGRLAETRNRGDLPIVVLALLLGLPAMIAILKFMPWAGANHLAEIFSLTTLPEVITKHVQRVMLLSLGSVIVVLARLTLGIRVLGPVRPILIALAFQLSGFVVGVTFLVMLMVVIAVVRPVLRTAGMAYFARIAVVLSIVCLMVLTTLKAGSYIGLDPFLRVGFLPVVVLAFAAEGFAKTLYREGAKSATWRALMTIVVAAFIKWFVGMPTVQHFVLRFPEVLIAQFGVIYLIGRYLGFRVFQSLNPSPRKVRKSSSRRKNKKKKNVRKGKRISAPQAKSLEITDGIIKKLNVNSEKPVHTVPNRVQ